MYTLRGTDDGFASGGKDGCVRLWDSDFKPITRMDLAQSSEGYQGNFANFSCVKSEVKICKLVILSDKCNTFSRLDCKKCGLADGQSISRYTRW